MTKERRLGRGLEALLGRGPDVAAADPDLRRGESPAGTGTAMLHRELPAIADEGTVVKPGESQAIAVSQIDPNPFQPRSEFRADELASLVESIKTNGLLQPVVVRVASGRYQLIAGERRWRAAKEVGWETIPAMFVEADDRQMAELALVENLHRADLNAVDKALSFQRYLEKFSATHEELAQRVNVDRTTVSNLIRLLELPPRVQAAVRAEHISTGHARALLPLETEQQQVELCERTIAEGLSVRALEAAVQAVLAADDGVAAHTAVAGAVLPITRGKRPAQVVALELELRQALGTKVDLRVNSRQRGKIVIHFSNQEEFERLREMLATPIKGKRQQAG
ncbi:MAG: ParB/RepB/Spo0J family partition protein [Pirellulales bacterium]|nr:ParB/RepB/Spo0J family partition protein [Pirellulales bacterium]